MSLGSGHHFFQCDVGDYNSVVRFREKVRANDLEVDILIANAGVGIRPGKLYEISLQEFNKIMKINVNGVFHTFKAFCWRHGGSLTKRRLPFEKGDWHIQRISTLYVASYGSLFCVQNRC